MTVQAAPKRYNTRRYDLDCYDKHLCLKPPFLLQVVIVLLCRDFLLPLVVGLASIKGAGGNMGEIAVSIRQPYWYLLGLPSLLVAYAWVRRVPTGDAVARWIWRNGSLLLSLSILLNAAATLADVWGGNLSDHPLRLLLVLLDSIALIYIWASRRVRDAFSDFPALVSSARPS